jgi:hypothetical protein
MPVEDITSYVAGLGRWAKEQRCRVDGVGCDVAPALFGLVEDRLIGVAVLHEPRTEAYGQFRQVAEAAALMRAGWSVNGLALLCEAFVGVGDAEQVDDLRAEFAAGNRDVHECVLVVVAAEDGEAVVAALPYRYGLGRQIVWGEPLRPTEVPPRSAVGYLDLFDRALDGHTVPMPPDTEAAVHAIAEVISEAGFVVRTFSDVEVR